jgi:ATP adenylyltransferase
VARDVLWAPWRMAYVGADAAPTAGCILCDLPARGESPETLVLDADERRVVLLNRYPYNNGHLMVAPRRHTADLGALDADEYGALMETVRRAATVLQRVLAPHAMNIGLNLGAAAGAGVADHLHWHLVPRWNGDTNFMPVIAEVKVMPQHLAASWALLRPHFA